MGPKSNGPHVSPSDRIVPCVGKVERHPGVGVASPAQATVLQRQTVSLNDAQLKALIVEKSVWLQNTVTGDKYMIIYGALGKGPGAKPLTPVEPGYVTQRFPANQGQFQVRYVGRQEAMQSLTGDTVDTSSLAPPGHTTSPTGRLLPRWSARRSRSPSTRWGTSISARAAASSATPTTRSFLRWRN